MKRKGFTYIELLVVITIITFLSASWTYYFNDFIKNKELEQKIITIENDFQELENKIKDYSIYDYEIILNTSSWWLWYISYVNNFDLPYNQYINFNSNTWSWSLWTNWNSSQQWNLKIYKNIKLYISTIIQSDTFYNYDFNDDQFYKIIWTLSWETLNEINIKYFTENNFKQEDNNIFKLTEINTKSDKSGTNITNLSIKNIWWNKTINWDWNDINEVYLFFEYNWKQDFININK